MDVAWPEGCMGHYARVSHGLKVVWSIMWC